MSTKTSIISNTGKVCTSLLVIDNKLYVFNQDGICNVYSTSGTLLTANFFNAGANVYGQVQYYSNSFYVPHYDSRRILKYSSTGVQDTNYNLSVTNPLANVIFNDILYVNQYGTAVIQTYNILTRASINTNFITLSPSASIGAIVIQNNVMYISTETPNVRTYNVQTGALLNASFITPSVTAYGMQVDATYLYLSLFTAGILNVYNNTSGSLVTSLVTGLTIPRGIALDNTHIYVAEQSSTGNVFKQSNPYYSPVSTVPSAPSAPGSVNYTGTFTRTPNILINTLLYDIYTLTGNGTLTVSFTMSNAPVLLVAGGGGGGGAYSGGEAGGGGGGGGVSIGSLTFVENVGYNIAIGNGGSGGSGGVTVAATNGGNSSIIGGTINEVAFGGGSGGSANEPFAPGGNGGSGGGSCGGWNKGSFIGTSTKGSGTLTRYGNNGGAGVWNDGGGGGGGGADSVGGNGSVANGGNGGNGYIWSVNSVRYGGGGGGGSRGVATAGLGGSGGGGRGGQSASILAAPGTVNTGGGGGGAWGGTSTTYYNGTTGGSGVVIVAILSSPTIYPCFLEGSKILKLNPETDVESYVPVESLQCGDLIRTFQNGYKAVFHIGKKTLPRPADDPDPRNRLYRFPKSISKNMTADLYITGEHCVLYKTISEELKERVRKHMGDVYITEHQYRVPACIDDRAESYADENSPVTIWHFALENHSVYRNYGVYANGLLVESCSIQYLTELSNMELI